MELAKLKKKLICHFSGWVDGQGRARGQARVTCHVRRSCWLQLLHCGVQHWQGKPYIKRRAQVSREHWLCPGKWWKREHEFTCSSSCLATEPFLCCTFLSLKHSHCTLYLLPFTLTHIHLLCLIFTYFPAENQHTNSWTQSAKHKTTLYGRVGFYCSFR
jgi:hypothetical protein